MGIKKTKQHIRRNVLTGQTRGNVQSGFLAPSVTDTRSATIKLKQTERRPVLMNQSLGDLSGGFPAPGSSGYGVILSNFSFLTTSVTHTEGASGAQTDYVFTVLRSGNLSGAITVDWAVQGFGSNPADPADFVGGEFPYGTLVFGVNEASQQITVSVSGDATPETNEQFAVSISTPNLGTVTLDTAVGDITNDDSSPPQFDIQTSAVVHAEGNSGVTAYVFTVTRSVNLTGTDTLDWSVAGTGANPATAVDFENAAFPSGTLTFSPTDTTKTITVNVAGGTQVEQDEQFTVFIQNPSLGQIGNDNCIGTITNDDSPPAPVFDISPSAVYHLEGDSGTVLYQFTSTRQLNTSGAATLDWAVSGTGVAPADATDFGGTFPSGTLSFADTESVKTINVLVSGDATSESSETFLVTISSPSVGAVGVATATGYITDDDTAPGSGQFATMHWGDPVNQSLAEPTLAGSSVSVVGGNLPSQLAALLNFSLSSGIITMTGEAQ